MDKKIGFALTGSFCCHKDVLEEIQKMSDNGFEILPIISKVVNETNTRFGDAQDLKNKLKKITGKDALIEINQSEPLGPKNVIDAIIIAPCTGNTLAKLANGISDNAITMATKSLMRNNKPVIIGISTNDALGLNLQNIAKLLSTKEVYFVPFKQDNYLEKPKSLVANWSKIEKTLKKAFKGEQLQPIIE